MADSSTQSTTIAAPPAQVADVIIDFESYPEWVKGINRVEVISCNSAGLPAEVRFVLDAGVVKDDYTLAYRYSADRTHIEWDLVRSDTQKSQHGSYDLREQRGDRTEVTYTLAVEPNMPMLGLFKRKAEKVIMDAALQGLKKRVER
jgi:ribosome-associated toxin RatA of RatAB toxin-antitoxin module